ncbi:MAG: cyclic nucleotide-binding domain-containing protein [Actinobacteria bacterium]|nr:cyclic nucleotide-binding domain-containing protein [Actinomycetota bacterium]
MTPIVLVVLLFVVVVIAVDSVRQRRIRAARAIDLRGLVAARLVEPGPAVFTGALASALTREPPVRAELYVNLTEALEVANLRPRLQEGAEVKIFLLRWGNDFAMLARDDRELHYRLEVWEAELLPKMDGTRTVGDLVVERMEAGGGLDAEPVTDLVVALYGGGFLDPAPIATNELIADRLDPSSPGRKKLKRFGKTLSIEWKGADRLVRFCYRNLLRPFFWWPVALVSGLVALAGLAAFIDVASSGRFSLGEGSAPTEAAILLALAFFLTFMHELGHSVVISHYGRKVKSAGFLIYFGSPAFFVEATDALMLERRQRILQASAGPFTELVIAGVAALAIFAFPDGPAADLLYKFALLNYIVIFLNLVPMLELDGYWILSDLIQVPDLRPRSLQFIQHDLWHKIRARERLTPQEWGLGGYGFAGIAFTIFSFWTGIVFWKVIFWELIKSLWNGGPGSRILLVLLAAFLAGPIIRGLLKLALSLARRVIGLARAVRFRLETTWRVEAAELIDAMPAFDDLPEDVLSDLAGRVRLRIVRPGEPVFRQGDRPDAFYVIRTGTVQIEDEDPETGDTRGLRRMSRGESFGEMGLLGSHRRQATVRAVDDVELFEVDKGTFDRLLAEDMRAPDFAHTMQALAELRELSVFHGLDSEQLNGILEHGEWITAAHGDELVTQGEPADRFYVIESGRAEIVRDGTVIDSVSKGMYFGEVALLRDIPRTATVVAVTPMRVFALDRDGFELVVADAFRRGTLRPAADRIWQH